MTPSVLFRHLRFVWDNRTEDTAYDAILEYLNVKVGKHAANMSRGQNFFTTSLLTLRRTGWLKCNIAGTSDIAFLLSKRSNLSRTECRYCIEVKVCVFKT